MNLKEYIEINGEREIVDIEALEKCLAKPNPKTTEPIKVESDPINPDHYKAGKLQTIEQMIIAFDPFTVARFCEVNSYKYHARAGLKGDAVLDHKKADWYMRLYERLIKYSRGQIAEALDSVREFLREEEEEKNGRNH